MSTNRIPRQKLDAVYDAFALYRRPLALEASPLRDPEVLLGQLTSKQLRLLEVEDVQDYALTALTTVGTVDDYKYFLPRLIELSTASGVIEPQVIALKLRYANWQTWPKNEQQVLEQVFVCACVDAFKQHPNDYTASDWFVSVAMLNIDLNQIQAEVVMSNNDCCALQLGDLLLADTLFEVDPLEQAYWEIVSDKTLQETRSWLLSEEVRTFLLTTRLRTHSTDDWRIEKAIAIREQLIQRRPQ